MQESFFDLIRSGAYNEIQKHLEENGLEILNAWFVHDVELDRIIELENYVNDDDDQMEVNFPMICLRPLQLAIVMKQKKIIEVILNYIVSNGQENDFVADLENILGHQATIIFPKDEYKIYDKDDRSLDGMNVFHLAAKYYPQGLEPIFDILKENDMVNSKILSLLLTRDRHLQQTPLHVSVRHASKGSSKAAR